MHLLDDVKIQEIELKIEAIANIKNHISYQFSH